MKKLHFFKFIEVYSGKKYIFQTLALVQLLLVSTVTNAIATNPGATCPSNYTQGTLTNADYSTLMSSYTNNSYVSVTGSNGIPLQINMSAIDSNTNTVTQNFAVNSTQTRYAINTTKDFPVWSANTQITLSFRNSTTQQPLYLTNVALSAFDIDYAISNGNYFDDAIKISGTTASGTTIRGALQTITGSNIVDDTTYGLITTSNTNCTAKNLGTACQGSIQFSEAVSSVTITYSNSNRIIPYSTNTTTQEIDFRLDNYCLAPYTFSGKVFNDTSLDGTINTGEMGIPGATVKLTNCDTGTILGTTTTATDGTYSFSFAANDTNITNLSKVCLVETNATGYKNDTTLNKVTINLLNGQNYPNNNFGDNNTTGLLQLIKYQQVVACNTGDLVALDSGFTTADLGVTTKVPSGSCIAYKIEATNLGNIPLTNVVITDSLMNDAKRISKIYTTPTPKLCLSGTATANCDTSKVTAPIDATTGTTKVTTSSFTIPGTGDTANKKASLYFNTLYSLK